MNDLPAYPEGVWYGQVRPADVAEIVERHLVGGQPVERLRLRALEEGGKPMPRPDAPGRPPSS